MDWTAFEIDLVIEDYVSMLRHELKGSPYNKSAHREALAKKLNSRSKGSIEFKHQNISAVLILYGMPYIRGYKPRWNYQKLLQRKIESYIGNHSWLDDEFVNFANQELNPDFGETSFTKIVVPPPAPRLFHEPQQVYGRRNVKRNYLELEQRNQSIGLAGEKLVLNYEVWRLKNSQSPELAKKVEWISQQDDSAGFDIYSKNEDGADRFIEVKSTTLGKETPIYFSNNENEFSKLRSEQFHLYRVFALNQNPQLFMRTGSFDTFCSMEALSYRGYFWNEHIQHEKYSQLKPGFSS